MSDGAVRAFIVALPFSSWGKEILSKCKPMKAIFKPEKNSVWNNLFVKMFGTRPAKTLGNVSAACVIAQMTKFMIPDVTSEDWYFRVLSPKYNAYKTIKEWIY